MKPGHLGNPYTPWCWDPMVTKDFIGGLGHLWATALRNWPPFKQFSLLNYKNLTFNKTLMRIMTHLLKKRNISIFQIKNIYLRGLNLRKSQSVIAVLQERIFGKLLTNHIDLLRTINGFFKFKLLHCFAKSQSFCLEHWKDQMLNLSKWLKYFTYN